MITAYQWTDKIPQIDASLKPEVSRMHTWVPGAMNWTLTKLSLYLSALSVAYHPRLSVVISRHGVRDLESIFKANEPLFNKISSSRPKYPFELIDHDTDTDKSDKVGGA